MPTVDLAFALQGTEPIPADHGYHLYGALSRILPQLHETNGIAVHPILGTQIGNRQLQLNDRSRLVLRTDADQIGQLIALAGKQLDVVGHRLRVGVPQVWTLHPTPAVRSRLVTIKKFLDAEPFQAAARRQLDEIGVSAEAQLTLGKRRTLRIKDKEVVGYEVLVEALSAEESLTLQERGLGGRRHMGCGVFMPVQIPADSVDFRSSNADNSVIVRPPMLHSLACREREWRTPVVDNREDSHHASPHAGSPAE